MSEQQRSEDTGGFPVQLKLLVFIIAASLVLLGLRVLQIV